MLKQTDEGVILPIKVTPKSRQNAIVGWESGELKIKIQAPPEKGKANEELICFLAKFFKIAKERVVLLCGETGRHKRVCLLGCTSQEIEETLKDDSTC